MRRISTPSTAPQLFTLILLSGLSTLTLNMFLPSLANIAASFQTDYTVVNLAVAAYMGCTAVLQLVVGPLSDRFGRRPVMLTALVIFILASVGCVLARDIWSFLLLRMLQSTMIAGWVLSLAVIRDTAPPQQAASRMGYLTMAMAIAPMLGPMLGGALDELFGWRASFAFFAAAGVALLCLTWVDMGETNKTPAKTSGKQSWGYTELLRSRRFWGYTLCLSFSSGAFYVFLAGSPLVARTVLDLSPALLGFYIGSITIGFSLGGFFSGRYASRYSLTSMIIAGRIIACGGLLLGLGLFLQGYVNSLSIFGATVFVGLGNGLTMPSANAGALSVRPGLTGSASGLAGALSIGGSALLTWGAGLVLNETHGHYQLLGMMLFCSLMALFAVLYVVRVERREARLEALQMDIDPA